MHAAAASIHAIGAGLAVATGRESRHAIKQVDRLLSNRGIEVEDLFEPWIRFVVAQRTELVVALDWTEFDADGQMTLALHLITTHGRSTALAWRTIYKRALESRRSEHERELLTLFRDALPSGVKVTVLADRGFGSRKLYADLQELGFDFVIRFRGRIKVTDSVSAEMRSASEWVPSNGRAVLIPNALVTADQSRWLPWSAQRRRP